VVEFAEEEGRWLQSARSCIFKVAVWLPLQETSNREETVRQAKVGMGCGRLSDFGYALCICSKCVLEYRNALGTFSEVSWEDRASITGTIQTSAMLPSRSPISRGKGRGKKVTQQSAIESNRKNTKPICWNRVDDQVSLRGSLVSY